jgi:hypothetical protein
VPAVPRFHLHVHDRSGLVRDVEGQDLPGLDAARAQAMRSARAIMAEDVRQGCLDLRGRVEVAGSDGAVLLTLRFGEAIEITDGLSAAPPDPC